MSKDNVVVHLPPRRDPDSIEDEPSIEACTHMAERLLADADPKAAVARALLVDWRAGYIRGRE